MDKKKQTKKWSYSPLGKGFRGFLCMITFMVFCVSAIIIIYTVESYGLDIFTDPKDSYYETEMYQNDLHFEMQTVLDCIIQLESEDTPNGTLSILDMSDNTIHYYDEKSIGEALAYNYSFGEDISDLAAYEVEESLEIVDKNLLDFDTLKSYLESDEDAVDCIYFDQTAFKDLFKKDGLLNTNHRFSEEFSENAYFVFGNYEVKKQTSTVETSESAEASTEKAVNEDKTEATTEVQADTAEKEEVTTEELNYQLEEGEEGSAEVQKETVVAAEEVIITPYNLTSYAVYDPEEGIFYSTGDDYFEAMDSYIYWTDDLLLHLTDVEQDGSYYNSIVIPLLRSYNNSVNEIVSSIAAPYSIMVATEDELAGCEGRGIYYYSTIDGDTCYSNVENEQAITSMECFYRFEKKADGELEQTHSTNVPDFKKLYSVREAFAGYPESAVFCLGFEKKDLSWPSFASSLIIAADNYNRLATNCNFFAILNVVSFLLLMVQAIWLICTTGRQYKGDKEVKLYPFDRWYTEIWAAVTAGLLVISFIGGQLILEKISYYQSIESNSLYMISGVLPAGFLFMILTLSLARRLKAHNIWDRLLVVKLGRFVINKLEGKNEIDNQREKKEPSAIARVCSKLWNRCKQAFYEIKGTRKLLVLFIVYMVAGLALLIAAMETQDGLPSLLFLALQVIALVVVLLVVKDLDKLTNGVAEITKGNLDSKVEINEKVSVFGDLAHGINHIGDGLKHAVETSLKDERMKTELITNVSHDLKTPLTSIINYVDLLKKQEMPNEDAKHYVEVLDGKAQRLKQLTEDLVEAAKATSGNIELEMMPLTFDELMKQALGEFEDKFEKKKLTIIATYPEKPAVVMADGRRLFRIIENVLQNIYKYAMEGTRVYADLSKAEGVVTFTLKNVSAAPLNISADELMERFTRGDSSRTTEGSGLGLSIAKDLTRLQNGEFEIQLDGDLFKVIIRFPEHK